MNTPPYHRCPSKSIGGKKLFPLPSSLFFRVFSVFRGCFICASPRRFVPPHEIPSHQCSSVVAGKSSGASPLEEKRWQATRTPKNATGKHRHRVGSPSIGVHQNPSVAKNSSLFPLPSSFRVFRVFRGCFICASPRRFVPPHEIPSHQCSSVVAGNSSGASPLEEKRRQAARSPKNTTGKHRHHVGLRSNARI
jgi:hypothetical protein